MTAPPAARIALSRTLDAPLDRVYAALTRPDALRHWFAPTEEFTVQVHEWDCRVGGRYRIAMHHANGAIHTCLGAFTEVAPNERIVMTFAWDNRPDMNSILSFALSAAGAGTRLDLTHEGFSDNDDARNHTEGWTGCLARLAAHLSN